MLALLGIMTWMSGSSMMNSVYQIGSAALVCIYFIYDVQLILGGKRFEITVDDYILASMTLYIDIVRIFLKIL